jgi:hypothetical protein
VVLALWVMVVCRPAPTHAQAAPGPQAQGLTAEDVLNLVRHGIPADQVTELIQRNPTDFGLSLEAIDNLKRDGVPPTVIDAMLKSRGSAASGQTVPPAPEPSTVDHIPPPNIHPARVSTGSPGAPGGQAAGPGTVAGGSASQQPPNSAARLQQAKSAQIPPDSWTPPPKQPDPGCPIKTKRKVTKVDLDYDTGSGSASRLGRSGMYCFALRNANPLYDWLLKLNVSEPTGNPFDLLNDAIQTLTKLSIGASSAKPTPLPTGRAPSCPDLRDVTQKATALKQALAVMVPGKDSSGKVAYIPLQETQKDWQAVPGAFSDLERSVRALVGNLPDNPDQGCEAVLQQAESTILDDYPKLRAQYKDLSERLARPDVQYLERPVEATASVDLVATPSYAGTADGSKTFHFEPSFGILSSSAGFLLTELPARSYSSATAPNPSDPTMTQNVLKVDSGAGIRPALIVLLTGNIPQLNRRNFGLGVSAGPVFDISNGKADTSRFGVFGGISVRLTPWIFLTPGVHVGEFADFPPGFTHPGQVIPPNTGTPAATKRYTARFAFAVTFKLKDLGASTASNQTKPQAAGPPQPAAGSKQ